MTQNIGKGNAPCGKCGRHIWNVPILLDTKEPDGKGGFWYKVAPGGKCLDCGEPLELFHVPGPEKMPLELLEDAHVELDKKT